ncbi:hypothetical protein QEN19_002421 [Hanseniaspora menglaensis]
MSASSNNSLETNIAGLINSTKVFLKALTRWTKKLETQKSISNHYVALGNDFQIVMKQFSALGIDMQNMRNVPKELRQILEKALKEEPSNESLDKYWPSIKEIIENLLNNIKLKRIELKKLQNESKTLPSEVSAYLEKPNAGFYQQTDDSKNSLSSGSINSLEIDNSESWTSKEKKHPYNKDYDIADAHAVSSTPSVKPDDADDISNASATSPTTSVKPDNDFNENLLSSVEDVSSAVSVNENEEQCKAETTPHEGLAQRVTSNSKLDPESELKKNKLSKFLSMSGFDEEEEEYFDDLSDDDDDSSNQQAVISESKLVMNELKKNNKIERRASKRYSAYHLTKHNSYQDSPEIITTEKESEINLDLLETVSKVAPASTILNNLSNDIAQKRNVSHGIIANGDKLSAILKNKVASNHEQQKVVTNDFGRATKKDNEVKEIIKTTINEPEIDKPNALIDFKKPGFITVFLKYNDLTLKTETTFPVKSSLDSLFAEKFSVTNDKTGTYSFIDPKYPGISYNVNNSSEELVSIEDGFIIELNKESKKSLHKDNENNKINKEFLAKIEQLIETSQLNILNKFETIISDSINANVPKDSLTAENQVEPLAFDNTKATKLKEVEAENEILRKEVVKMDSRHTEEVAKLKKMLAQSLSQLDVFKKTQVSKEEKLDDTKDITDLKYTTFTTTKISSDGDSILSKVDDLQDVIEIVRKDVAVRGVKPKKSNLDAIKKELESTEITLSEFDKFIKENKPKLKDMWEAQLVSICDQQQSLALQEDLILDLQSDMEKCKETLDLIVLLSEERSKKGKQDAGKKQVLLPLVKPGDMVGVRDQLLQDIELLKPDHKSRIEAIEKHEKFSEINK